MSYVPPDFPEDRINPYAPPKAEFVERPLEFLPSAYVPFNIGDILSRAFELFKLNAGLCIGVVLIQNLANIFSQIASGILNSMASVRPDDAGMLQGLGVLISIFVTIVSFWLSLGQLRVMVKIAKGQQAEFSEVFAGGRYFWRAVGAALLTGLCVTGVMLLCIVPFAIAGVLLREQAAAVIAIIGVGIVVFLGVILFVSARLGQSFYLIVDRNVGPMEALRLSAEITRGKVLTIILMMILMGAINIAGLLACLVGLIFTVPLTTLMMAVMYIALTGTSQSSDLIFPDAKPPLDLDFDGVV